MYFPYFRGRQYELLALKELVSGQLLSKSVIPVVEPIKLTSTFAGTLEAFVQSKRQIAIIFNPAVGGHAGADNFANIFRAQFGAVSAVLPTLLMGKNTDEVIQSLAAQGIVQSDIIAILDKRDFLDVYKEHFSEISPQYTLFPDERQIKRSVTQSKVMFEDKFIKQEKNADYKAVPDEFFSDDHLFFSEEGYVGFGDYSVVGNVFDEGGFAPKAVAIHIVYFDDDGVLRIHHFVSDSNMDIKDVAGKYYEAVTKLADWFKKGHQSQATNALLTFVDHYENGYYPGLPTIKKLSIMHHLELMSKHLDRDVAE